MPRGRKVAAARTGADSRVAASMTDFHKQLMKKKNASWARWLAGWAIPGGVALSSGTTPNTGALSLLIAGNVDIFTQAVTPTVPNPQIGTFNIGQSPYNNFLGNNVRPFNALFPEAGGIYMGTLWDMYSGLPAASGPMSSFYSSMVENTLVVIYKNQNPEGYFPWLTIPPGARLERRLSSTIDNSLITTEGFGPMTAMGLKKFREDERWDPNTQLSCQLQPSKGLQTYLATLTTENTPPAGSVIAFVGYGVELRKIQTGV